jgi:hypothetical protein
MAAKAEAAAAREGSQGMAREQEALLSVAAARVAAELEAHRRWRQAMNQAADHHLVAATAVGGPLGGPLGGGGGTPRAGGSAAGGSVPPPPQPPPPPPPSSFATSAAAAAAAYPAAVAALPDAAFSSVEFACACALQQGGLATASARDAAHAQLGLAPGTDTSSIVRRYRLLARLLHPDKLQLHAGGGGLAARAGEAFRVVTRAHALLVKGET